MNKDKTKNLMIALSFQALTFLAFMVIFVVLWVSSAISLTISLLFSLLAVVNGAISISTLQSLAQHWETLK